jgi:hypothetical protein
VATFELRGESYRLISKEGLDLSDEAKAALLTAKRPMGKTERRVECSAPVAQEMQNWWTCPDFVDTWVKLPMLRDPTVARRPGG